MRLQDELKRAEMVELRRLRGLVLQHSHALRSNARLVDELDCLLGFAQLAMEMQLVRPEMVAQSGDEVVFDVEAGRHIGVELGLLDRTDGGAGGKVGKVGFASGGTHSFFRSSLWIFELTKY